MNPDLIYSEHYYQGPANEENQLTGRIVEAWAKVVGLCWYLSLGAMKWSHAGPTQQI